MKTHPEETKKQKHECKQCKKSYPRMKDLKMHVRRTHETASQTHKCPNCEKSYSHVHDLKVHIRKVHEGFRHNCHLCDKSYTGMSIYRRTFYFTLKCLNTRDFFIATKLSDR